MNVMAQPDKDKQGADQTDPWKENDFLTHLITIFLPFSKFLQIYVKHNSIN